MSEPWEDFTSTAVAEPPPWEDFKATAPESVDRPPWEDFAPSGELTPSDVLNLTLKLHGAARRGIDLARTAEETPATPPPEGPKGGGYGFSAPAGVSQSGTRADLNAVLSKNDPRNLPVETTRQQIVHALTEAADVSPEQAQAAGEVVRHPIQAVGAYLEPDLSPPDRVLTPSKLGERTTPGIAAQVVSGSLAAMNRQTAETLTDPVQLALLATGAAPVQRLLGTAAPLVSRAVDAYFLQSMARSTPDVYQKVLEAHYSGDAREKADAYTGAALQAAMMLLVGKHTVAPGARKAFVDALAKNPEFQKAVDAKAEVTLDELAKASGEKPSEPSAPLPPDIDAALKSGGGGALPTSKQASEASEEPPVVVTPDLLADLQRDIAANRLKGPAVEATSTPERQTPPGPADIAAETPARPDAPRLRPENPDLRNETPVLPKGNPDLPQAAPDEAPPIQEPADLDDEAITLGVDPRYWRSLDAEHRAFRRPFLREAMAARAEADAERARPAQAAPESAGADFDPAQADSRPAGAANAPFSATQGNLRVSQPLELEGATAGIKTGEWDLPKAPPPPEKPRRAYSNPAANTYRRENAILRETDGKGPDEYADIIEWILDNVGKMKHPAVAKRERLVKGITDSAGEYDAAGKLQAHTRQMLFSAGGEKPENVARSTQDPEHPWPLRGRDGGEPDANDVWEAINRADARRRELRHNYEADKAKRQTVMEGQHQEDQLRSALGDDAREASVDPTQLRPGDILVVDGEDVKVTKTGKNRDGDHVLSLSDGRKFGQQRLEIPDGQQIYADEWTDVTAREGGADQPFSKSRPQAQAPAADPRAVRMVRNVALPHLARWKGAPEVVYSEIPGHPEAEGGIVDGKLYLNPEQLPNPAAVRRVLFHEAIGHHGIEAIVGDAFFDAVVKRMERRGDVKTVTTWDWIKRNYPESQWGKEVIAQLAEGRIADPGMWATVKARVIQFARRLGFHGEITDAEIRVALRDALKAVEGGTVEAKLDKAALSIKPSELPSDLPTLMRIKSELQARLDEIDASEAERPAETIGGAYFPKGQSRWSAVSQTVDLMTDVNTKIAELTPRLSKSRPADDQADLFHVERKTPEMIAAEKAQRDRETLEGLRQKRLVAGELETQKTLLPEPGQQSLFSKAREPIDEESARDRIRSLQTEIGTLAAKGGLTAKEAARFRVLSGEANSLRFDIAKPLDPAKIPTPQDRKSTLPNNIVLTARNDLLANKGVYTPIIDAAIGVSHNAETAVDDVIKGKNPDVSPRQFYDTFAATRSAMKAHYGDTIRLFRAISEQRAKPTTNWATTEEYAKQFGPRVISKDVPIDDILAVNVGLGGRYHEIIVGNRPTESMLSQPRDELPPQTGIKNAETEADRARLGHVTRDVPYHREPQTMIDEARARMSADPQALPNLVAEFKAKPFPLSTEDGAMIVAARADAKKLFNQAVREVNTGGDPTARDRMLAAEDRFIDLGRIAEKGGTLQSESFAFRRGLVDEADQYELANLIEQKRANTGRDRLTEKEYADLAKLAVEFKEKADAFEKHFDQVEQGAKAAYEELDKARAEVAHKESIIAQLKPSFDAAKADYDKAEPSLMKRIKGAVAAWSGELLSKSRDAESKPLRFADVVQLGATFYIRGKTGFGEWSDAMREVLGDKINPHLQRVFDAAEADVIAKVNAKSGGIPSAARVIKGTPKAAPTIEELSAKVESKARNGQFDAITHDVQKLVRALVTSGIREREPLIDAVHDVLKRVTPDVTRLEAMDAISGRGQFTLPSQEDIAKTVRDLKQQIRLVGHQIDVEAKRPLPRTGPQRDPMSDAARRELQKLEELKRRLGVVVTDPTAQLASVLQARRSYYEHRMADLRAEIDAKARTVKNRTPAPTSPELDKLIAEYKTVKAEHEAIFTKPGLTDAQRVALAQKGVERSIADLEARIKAGDITPRKTAPGPSSPELEAARARRDALREQLQEMRDAVEPKKTPEEIALQSAKTRLTNRLADLHDKLARHDYSTAKRKPVELDKVGLKLKADVETVKRKWEKEKETDRLARRTPGEIRKDAILNWRREFILSTPSAIFKLAAAAVHGVTIEPVKEAVGIGLSKAFPRFSARTEIDRPSSYQLEKKAFIHGISHWAADFKSNVHPPKWLGRVSPSKFAELEAAGWGKGTDFENAHGGKDPIPPEMRVWWGGVHGGLKSPLKRSSWIRTNEKLLNLYDDRGLDIKTPEVQMLAGTRAFQEANRQLFMEDNRVVQMWKRAMSTWQPKAGEKATLGQLAAQTAGGVVLPIVRIPTNLIARSFQSIFGSVWGSAKLAAAYARGIEKLAPEDADLIMRQMKAGSVGGTMMLLGYFFGPSVVGSFYQPGDSKDPNRLKPGAVVIGGVRFPANLFHRPEFAAAEWGATMRRIAEARISKKTMEENGLTWGAIAASLGLVKEVPFVKEMFDAQKLVEIRNAGMAEEYAKSQTAGYLTPGLLQWLAKQSDKENPWSPLGWMGFGPEATKRKPTTLLEHVEMGIPGLRERVPAAKK